MHSISLYNPQEQPRRGTKTTGRGATPAKSGMLTKPRRGDRALYRPYRTTVPVFFSRGYTPACNLISPSGFSCTYNHIR